MTAEYLSGLVGAHEEGMSREAFSQTATSPPALLRLPTGVADHLAAAQVVLIVCAACAVSSLQRATELMLRLLHIKLFLRVSRGRHL